MLLTFIIVNYEAFFLSYKNTVNDEKGPIEDGIMTLPKTFIGPYFVPHEIFN